jgi:hypothetical protein
MPQATRAEVYAAIDSEREYQDSLSRNIVNKEGDPTFSPMTNLCIIDELCAQMKAEFYKNPGHPPMDYMRKIAATATRTMEAFGAPEREVPQEGSTVRTGSKSGIEC